MELSLSQLLLCSALLWYTNSSVHQNGVDVRIVLSLRFAVRFTSLRFLRSVRRIYFGCLTVIYWSVLLTLKSRHNSYLINNFKYDSFGHGASVPTNHERASKKGGNFRVQTLGIN